MKLSEENLALLTPEQTVGQYIEVLRRRGLTFEAIQVLAQWLPRPTGVGWTCRCLRESLPAEDLKTQAAALEAAERWAAEPTEAHRRAAGAAAEAADYETPAALAALAAFWSAGSMAPAEAPEVPAPPHLAPGAMANAMQLAAVVGEPETAGARLERFLDAGLAVAGAGERAAHASAIV